MQSNFSINYIFEEDLKVNFTVSDGIFNTNNQSYIIQHAPSIQNIQKLTEYKDSIDFLSDKFTGNRDSINAIYNLNITLTDIYTENPTINIISNNGYALFLGNKVNIQSTSLMLESLRDSTYLDNQSPPQEQILFNNQQTDLLILNNDGTIEIFYGENANNSNSYNIPDDSYLLGQITRTKNDTPYFYTTTFNNTVSAQKTYPYKNNGSNINNYFIKEYRYSFDTITWSDWLELHEDFDNFSNNILTNTWIQIKYTYITDGTVQAKLNEIFITGKRKIAEIFEASTLAPDNSVSFTNQDTFKVFELTGFYLYLKKPYRVIKNANEYLDLGLEINFRYTQTQGRKWSQWIPFTEDHLKNLKLERVKFTNFQFNFTNTSTENIELYDLELEGNFQNITANYNSISRLGLKTQCDPLATEAPPTGPCVVDNNSKKTCGSCCAGSEALTPWNQNIENCGICSGSGYTQINDRSLWKGQIDLYNTLNNFINATNSWKTTYLLTDPDNKGIDHILHEQQIHNVIQMKEVQIIIPDNQFPVDNINFSGLDLDLIQSFEIHILKDEFKTKFGVEFRPGRRDVVYICDINQLWEVEQMFPKRGFMNAQAYYRVLMKKYNQKASRQFAKTDEGQKAKDFTDNLSKFTTLDDLFEINNNNAVSDEIKQTTKNDNNNSNTSALPSSQQYQHTSLLHIRKNMAANTNIIKEEIWNKSLLLAKNCYEIPLKSKGQKSIIYETLDNKITKGNNRAITFWFNTSDYLPEYEFDIFNNYENNSGIKILIKNNCLYTVLNTNEYFVQLPNFQEETWYCVLVNIDNTAKKLELAIYQRQNEINGMASSTSELLLYNKIIYDINFFEFEHSQNVYIGGSDTKSYKGNRGAWYITNILLLDYVLDIDKRKKFLNGFIDGNVIIYDKAEYSLINSENYGNI